MSPPSRFLGSKPHPIPRELLPLLPCFLFYLGTSRPLPSQPPGVPIHHLTAAKPDYKKAYVTLRSPLSVSPDLFPIGVVLGERERKASAAAARRKAVEGAEVEGEGKGRHWMEDEREGFSRAGCGKVVYGNPGRLGRKRTGGAKVKQEASEEGEKFPWNGLRLATEKPTRRRHSPPKKKGTVMKQRSRKGSVQQRSKKKVEA